jgi:hypothetical protein
VIHQIRIAGEPSFLALRNDASRRGGADDSRRPAAETYVHVVLRRFARVATCVDPGFKGSLQRLSFRSVAWLVALMVGLGL